VTGAVVYEERHEGERAEGRRLLLARQKARKQKAARLGARRGPPKGVVEKACHRGVPRRKLLIVADHDALFGSADAGQGLEGRQLGCLIEQNHVEWRVAAGV